MENLSLDSLRRQLAKVVKRVQRQDERFLITRRGKDTMAIVSVADLALLEKLEDLYDINAAERVLSDSELSKRIPLDQIEKEFGF
jgi:prevent-host-death family protein